MVRTKVITLAAFLSSALGCYRQYEQRQPIKGASAIK